LHGTVAGDKAAIGDRGVKHFDLSLTTEYPANGSFPTTNVV